MSYIETQRCMRHTTCSPSCDTFNWKENISSFYKIAYIYYFFVWISVYKCVVCFNADIHISIWLVQFLCCFFKIWRKNVSSLRLCLHDTIKTSKMTTIWKAVFMRFGKKTGGAVIKNQQEQNKFKTWYKNMVKSTKLCTMYMVY